MLPSLKPHDPLFKWDVKSCDSLKILYFHYQKSHGKKPWQAESRFSNQMLKPSLSYYFISCFLNLSIYHFLFIITFINCLNLLNSSLAFIFFFSFLFQSFFWFFFRENIKKDSNICFLQQLIHDIPSFLPSFRKKKRLKY